MDITRNKNIGIIDVDFDEGVTVVEPVNLYGCKLGKNVFVGPFVEIQKNVSVDENSKIAKCSLITPY